ncbi:MAG: tripartite tricarboxylate transporter TctB family protein, partial [Bradyrhizobium sp.]|nr:tripartite tricarboxylate transporter TctB family protein [Bradyrhizobium sp.]
MTTESAGAEPPSRGIDKAGIVIAGLLAAVALVLVYDANQIPATTMYGMGPQVMPVVIAIGLGILALANLIDAVRGN